MPRMKFSTRAKYKGAYHDALVPFDVDGADVPELQKLGGVLIIESEPEKEPDSKPEKAVSEEMQKPDEVQKPKGRKKADGGK